MIALLIVIAGYCLIFGARGAFDKTLRTVAGLILILTFLPGLLIRCEHELASRDVSRPEVDGGSGTHAWLILLVLALIAVGIGAWKLRHAAAKRKEARRRLDSHPRARALPPAPQANEEETWS